MGAAMENHGTLYSHKYGYVTFTIIAMIPKSLTRFVSVIYLITLYVQQQQS